MGILKTLTINGTTYKITPVVPASSVTLLADKWVVDGKGYSQVVEVEGVTPHSKVNLQPTKEQLDEFHDKILAFVAKNSYGVVTVYSVGDKPDGDHTIQTTLREVEGAGEIWGNTVGTTMPRSNLQQEDPTRADYVQGKEVYDNKIKDLEEAIKTGGGDIQAIVAEVLSSEELARIVQDLEDIKAEMNYVDVDITSFSCTGAGTYEVGVEIDPPTVTWVLNRTPASQKLNNETLDTAQRKKVYTEKVTTNQTYTLVVTGEKGETDKATASISFYNGVYYGVIADGTAITSAAILGLTRKLQGSKGITFTANAGEGYRIAYAIPTAYGTPVFNVGGFDGGFSKAATISHTNASGHTENYDVWLSDNMNLGSTTVKVS